MSPQTVYFIAGASRGIGLALARELVENRTDVYVFAGARTFTRDLTSLAAKHPDKVSIVKWIAADEAANKVAAEVVGAKFGRVDTVLGLAGILQYVGTAEETPAHEVNEHFRVNALGMLVLYRAFAQLLKKSEAPKFIPFTAVVASQTAYFDFSAGYTCYGMSKVALNHLALRIHHENDWITCFPLSPGVVKTDMANALRVLDKSGNAAQIQDLIAVELDVAAKMLLSIIEDSTRESHSGKFWNIDGNEVPW